jgi:hypothetical protein
MNDLNKLVAGLIAAKSVEAAARAKRIALEEAIIAAVGAKEEGAQTHAVGDYRVTVTGKLSYSADIALLANLAEQLPADRRPIKQVTQLDEAGARWLRKNAPQEWAIVAPAIEIKPAKTALTIKEA